MLREHYPSILAAFADRRGSILHPEARALLSAAGTPTAAVRQTKTQLRAILERAGLHRGIEAEADRLRTVLRREDLTDVGREVMRRGPHREERWRAWCT